MTMYAPSQVTTPNSGENAGLQLSDEEHEKLQEIHELINRMLMELPVMGQLAAQPYGMTNGIPLPAVPYTYSVFQMPWGGMPYFSQRVI